MSTVHIYPTNDLIKHDINSDDCECLPTIEECLSDHGDLGWLIVHNALDGRE